MSVGYSTDSDPITPQERLKCVTFEPRRFSEMYGWSGLQAEYFRDPPDSEVNQPPLTHNLIVLYHRVPEAMTLRYGSVNGQEPPPPGSMSIMPAGVYSEWSWRGRSESVHVSIEPRVIARVASEAFGIDGERFELPDLFNLHHPGIRCVIQEIDRELANPDACGHIVAEHLGEVLALRLIREFARPRAVPSLYRGLSGRQLRAVDKYIQENMEFAITLSALAVVAHCSLYHFARLFKLSRGITPYKYVILHRVERAKELIQAGTGLTLAQIAVRCGFSDQGHMTRHFRRTTGVTPGRFL